MQRDPAAGEVVFREPRDAGCNWSDEAARTLHAVLARAGEHGLPPSLFHVDEIARSVRPATTMDRAQRDPLLTASALRYAEVMRRGRVDLAPLHGDVAIHRWNVDPVSELATALAGGHLAHWLDSLPPSAPEYVQLKRALARYREMERQGGWPVLQLPLGKRSLKPDETSTFVPQLRARLRLAGDLVLSGTDERYDPAMVDAVRSFQARHGLAVDGVVGRDTLAALNVPAEMRVRQIALNMERWRFMAHAMPLTRIEVNAAAAEAVVMKDGEIVFRMRTIVGKKTTPTPLIVSAIERIIVNPSWIVPSSIYRREIAPAIARDPDYLQKHEMSWQGDRLVQKPGPKNALGRLKFDLPSPFAVFLHDTNSPGLFASDNRFRSNGCIRVERPMELAVLLLEPSGWSRERIEELVQAEDTVSVFVDPPVPVVVAYWTAFVEADGLVRFRDDIYGRDAALGAALAEIAPPSLTLDTARDCGA
ncbi:murein L,D-transpeptidase [Parvibaculum sp.]|uniref:murein L,D-transpeptidase n=1 Tax=Parvibaculum sp. TaxID=2024848 RepID=UPI00349FECB8